MTVQGSRENFFTKTSAFGLFQLRKTGARKCGLVDLNNERTQLRCVSVVMRVKASELGFDERLRQSLETLGGTKPGEPVCHKANRRPEFARLAAAHQRVDAVGTDNEIGRDQIIEDLDCETKDGLNADRDSSRLQQLQQLQPTNGRKADTNDHHALAAMRERDVVP